MPSLGQLWYAVNIKDNTAAEIKKIEQKLSSLGITVDASKLRMSIDSAIGSTPFSVKVSFDNARASLDAVLSGNKHSVNVEVVASKLHSSIVAALNGWNGAKVAITPKTKELRQAVTNALLSSGFEVNIGKVKGLSTTISSILGADHPIKISVDPKKLADAISRAASTYKGTPISLEAKEKILKDSINHALKSEKFPIKIVVNKAEAQDAVRQALQAAGIQNSGFTASDKRAWDAQSRRMEAQARATAAAALAQRRLAGAHNAAQRAADSHIRSSISLGSSMRGNIRIAGELGTMLASAYSIIALKNFTQKVIEVGGELEKQKLAMNAILGDEGMANTITSQINSLAVKSPFGVLELNQYAKQLTAFQIPYNELYDTMKRLADISAAVGVDMGRITLAFGQVRAAKFLKGTELRQFTEANIPLLDMLSKRFTALKGEIVSAGEVMSMISKKEVSFEDVKAALWELTGEGGKFYNMQEVLSESVQAKWKNLADAVDLMFGEIVKSSAGGLTAVAEVLTGLTTKWKTYASVIAATGVAFGVAKVSTLVWNAAISKTTLSAIAEAKAAKQMDVANLKVASTYRTLTAAEQGLIRTKGKLTAAQYVQLAATGRLTKEEALRLIALKKLDANTIGHIRGVLNISKAEVSAAQSAKAWRVRLEQLKVSLAGFGRSIATALFNPVSLAMAAFGALAALRERNSEEMAKAKEIGDNIATSASEGFKNLKSSVENFKPGEGLTEVQLTQGIEDMQQLIKDYSPTPIEDINNALVAQDGHVRSLIEQYETLKNRLEKLEGAYKGIDRTFGGLMVEGALKAADGGNWFTQIFNDGLAENAKDYTDALGRVADRIAKYSREYPNNMKSAVNAAWNADEGFRNAVAGMRSYDEMLRYLAGNSKKYYNAATAFDLEMNGLSWGKTLDYFSNALQIKAAREELLKDTDKVIADYNSRLRQKGINPLAMTDQQKTEVAIAMRLMLTQLDGAGEDAKALIAQKLEESWTMAGMIMEDKIGPSMQEKFKTLIAASTDEGVKVAARKLQYEGYTALSNAEKALVSGLMGQAQMQTMNELGIVTVKMQEYLNAHPLEQIITLAYASEQPSDLARELAQKIGYPALTGSTDKHIKAWAKGNSVYAARNAAQSALQNAQKELDAAKKTGVGIEAAQKEWDEVWETIQKLGWTDLATKDQESNKHDKEKDEFAEAIKERINLLKKAKSEYERLANLVGTEAASKKLAESPIFAGLKANEFLPKQSIPKTLDDYEKALDELQEKLTAKGLTTKKHRELNIEIEQVKFDINKKKTEEALKLDLDKVSKEAERQLADWNLFDKIRKATGNQDLAMSIAFGLNADADTDYVGMIKKQFAAVADQYDNMKGLTYDMVKDESYLEDAPEEVRKAWEKANSEILKYFDSQRDAVAGILSEYQTLQDQLAKIDYDRGDKIAKVQAAENLTPEQKEQLTQQINAAADYDKFTKSEEYLQFFNDVYALTLSEANRIGDLIQQNLNRKLQSGLITLIDYEKEMSKVRKQLDAMRNVKSDSMVFLTGGLKGLYSQKLQKEEAKLGVNDDYQKALAQQVAAQEALNRAQESGNEAAIAAAKEQLNAANKAVAQFTKQRDWLANVLQMMERISAVIGVVSGIAQGISAAFNSIRETAEALGVDTESSGWLDFGGVIDTFASVTSGVDNIVKSAMSGSVSGVIGGLISAPISTVTSPFTIWAKIHDKKLQKQIEQSQQQVKLLQNLSSLISSRMKDYLGNARNMEVPEVANDKRVAAAYGKMASHAKGAFLGLIQAKAGKYQARVDAYESGGAYGYQRQLMHEEIDELEKQRQAELDKKDTDSAAVAEYEKQIEELKIQIMQFAEDTANSLYGIDIKGWASEFGDALYQAWQQGEDGAKAFEKTAGDIIGRLMNNVLTVGMIEPMFKDLQTYLFGTDGESGAFGSDFELTPEEVDGMAQRIMKGMEGVDAYNSALEQLEKVLNGKYGITMKEESSGGLSAGIQGVTEDTADLLASYINAIRADVSEQAHILWPRLLDDMLPQMNAIAESQLREQKKIAANTLRNAVAAERIAESTDTINGLLTRATQGGAKFYVQ